MEDFGHVQLMESDEAEDLLGRSRIVVFGALLDGEVSQSLLDCMEMISYCRMGDLTFLNFTYFLSLPYDWLSVPCTEVGFPGARIRSCALH